MKSKRTFIGLIVSSLLSNTFAQMTPVTQTFYDDALRLRIEAQKSSARPSIDVQVWLQAVNASEKAVSVEPTARQPLRLRAEIYTQIRFWAKAETAWNAYFVVATDSDEAANMAMSEVQFNLGYSAYERAQATEAERYFTQALESNIQNQLALVWKARIALERGDGASAVPLLEQALVLKTDDKVAAYALSVARKSAAFGNAATQAFFIGYSAYGKNQKDLALVQFRKATVTAPGFTEAQRWLGRTALELNQGQEASRAYETVMKLEGALPETIFNLNLAHEVTQFGLQSVTAFRAGYAKYAKGDKFGAMQSFDVATTTNPNHQKAWAWLGRVRFETNDFEGAVVAYQKAAQLDPLDKSSAYFLRQAQIKLGR